MTLFSSPTKKIPSKRQMIERLQFSKNLQVALKCCQLIDGEISEQHCKGMFLDAVCRNDYEDALKRADDHNKAALIARDFSIGYFRFNLPDVNGYETGKKYYLKIMTKNGHIEVWPTANCQGDEMIYLNFNKFFESWSIF